MADLSANEKQRLLDAIRGERPPTLGVVGLSGVGKSSTINALFKTSLPISHTAACTKEFWSSSLEVQVSKGDFAGDVLQLRVIDAPGLGEELRVDPTYLEMYGRHLPECDAILWVLNARNRAIALDQMYLETLREFQPKMVFGLSQVDLVHPLNWHPQSLIPSPEQRGVIKEILADREARLSAFLGRSVSIIPFSAERGYNMADLFLALLRAAPKGRKWLFDPLLNYDLESWVAKSSIRTDSRATAARPPRPQARTESSERFWDKLRSFKLSALFDSPVPERVRAEIEEALGRKITGRLSTQELAALEDEVARRRRENLEHQRKAER
jgi:small GTP-binding protein